MTSNKYLYIPIFQLKHVLAFPPVVNIKQEPKDDYSSLETSWHDEEFVSLMNDFTDLAQMVSNSIAKPSQIRATTPQNKEVSPLGKVRVFLTTMAYRNNKRRSNV